MFRVIQELYNTDSEVLSYRKKSLKYLIIQFKAVRLLIRIKCQIDLVHKSIDIPVTKC